jgi:hypothetical protein
MGRTSGQGRKSKVSIEERTSSYIKNPDQSPTNNLRRNPVFWTTQGRRRSVFLKTLEYFLKREYCTRDELLNLAAKLRLSRQYNFSEMRRLLKEGTKNYELSVKVKKR